MPREIQLIVSNPEIAKLLNISEREIEELKIYNEVVAAEEAAKAGNWSKLVEIAGKLPQPYRKYIVFLAVAYHAPKEVVDKVSRLAGVKTEAISLDIKRVIAEARKEASKRIVDVIIKAFNAAARGETPPDLAPIMKAVKLNGVSLYDLALAEKIVREKRVWDKLRKVVEAINKATELIKNKRYRDALYLLNSVTRLLTELEGRDVVLAADKILKTLRNASYSELIKSIKDAYAKLVVFAALGSGDYTFAEQMLEYAGLEELGDIIEVCRRIDEGEATKEDVEKLIEYLRNAPEKLRKAVVAFAVTKLLEKKKYDEAVKVAGLLGRGYQEKIRAAIEAPRLLEKLNKDVTRYAQLISKARFIDTPSVLHDIITDLRKLVEIGKYVYDKKSLDKLEKLLKTFEAIREATPDAIAVQEEFRRLADRFSEAVKTGSYEEFREVSRLAESLAERAARVSKRFYYPYTIAPDEVVSIPKALMQYFEHMSRLCKDLAYVAYHVSRAFEGMQRFAELLSKYASSPEYTFRNRAYRRKLADAIGIALDAYKHLIRKRFSSPVLDRLAYLVATKTLEYFKRMKAALVEQPPRDEWKSVFEEAERLYGVSIPVEEWSWPEPPKDALRAIAYWTLRIVAWPFEQIVKFSKRVEDWAWKLHEEAWRQTFSPNILEKIHGYLLEVVASAPAMLGAIGSGTALRSLQHFFAGLMTRPVETIAEVGKEIYESFVKYPAFTVGSLVTGALLGYMLGEAFTFLRVPPRLQPVLTDIVFGNPPGLSLVFGKISEPIAKRLYAILAERPKLAGKIAIAKEGIRVETDLELIGRSSDVAEALERIVRARIGRLEEVVPEEIKPRLENITKLIAASIRGEVPPETVETEFRNIAAEILKSQVKDALAEVKALKEKVTVYKEKLTKIGLLMEELEELTNAIRSLRGRLEALKLVPEDVLKKLEEAEKAAEEKKPLTSVEELKTALHGLAKELTELGKMLGIPEAERLLQELEKPVEKPEDIRGKVEAVSSIDKVYRRILETLKKKFSVLSRKTIELWRRLRARRRKRVEELYDRLLEELSVWLRERVRLATEEVYLPELKEIAKLLKETVDTLPGELKAEAMRLIPKLESGRLTLSDIKTLAEILARIHPGLKALPYLETARATVARLKALLEEGAEIAPELRSYTDNVVRLESLIASKCEVLHAIHEFVKSNLPVAVENTVEALIRRLELAGVKNVPKLRELWARFLKSLEEGKPDVKALSQFIREVGRIPAVPKSLKARLLSLATRLRSIFAKVPELRSYADLLLDAVRNLLEYPDNYVAVRIGLGRELIDPIAVPKEMLPVLARAFEEKTVTFRLGNLGEVEVRYIPRILPGEIEAEIIFRAPDGAVVRYLLRRIARWVKTDKGWRVETRFIKIVSADPPDSPLAALLLRNAEKLAMKYFGDRLALLERIVVLPNTPLLPSLRIVFAYPRNIVTTSAKTWSVAIAAPNHELVEELKRSLSSRLEPTDFGYIIKVIPPILIIKENLEEVWRKFVPVMPVLVTFRGVTGIGLILRRDNNTYIGIPDVDVGSLQLPPKEVKTVQIRLQRREAEAAAEAEAEKIGKLVESATSLKTGKPGKPVTPAVPGLTITPLPLGLALLGERHARQAQVLRI